jgi:16S rRNA (guanine966-N2)-methyltransferase
VTRIVAGTHRGRPLAVPAGATTRPTADRAREGLFSSLQSLVDLEGAAFLDLYAGSGALGLEALSRGAARATLVESDERALTVLRANAAGLGLPAEVVGQPVERFLTGSPEPYDVVVLDPPYELDVDPVLVALLPWAADVVVVERRTRGPEPAWPEGLEPLRSRRYGEATLWYGSRS